MSIFRKSALFIYKSNFNRRLFLLINDIFILIFSYFFSLRISYTQNFSDNNLLLILIIVSYSIPINIISGQYSGITKFINSKDIYMLIIRQFFVLLLSLFTSYIVNLEVYNYEFWVLFFLITGFISSVFRIIIRDIITSLQILKNQSSKKIVIYGAGAFGVQISNYYSKFKNCKVLFFIDDNSELWTRNINGIPIKNPNFLKKYRNKLDEIIIGSLSINKKKLKEIFLLTQSYSIPILKIPSFEDNKSEKDLISTLKPIQIEDLLFRHRVKPIKELFNDINKKSIMVTGAGGSIGSEICNQISKLNPSLLVLLDNNEFNLYKSDRHIRKNNKLKVKTILGSSTNNSLMEEVFKENKIDIVFHAAAYKHVPLLEDNLIEAIKNNILSTNVICELSKKYKVKKVVLISSDKAVRPTNIMGVTKRISELIIQAYALDSKDISDNVNATKYTMVRFGNVLGSSGSVVPLFLEQINEGGPLTITNKDVNRYFMTVYEAAELVIQASSMANGGEVFLLDMGDPVKILDLAKEIINLCGLKVKDKNNINGDIEIVFTGLRPGEKLYEELLINSKAEKTINPLIFKAKEKMINKDSLDKYLIKIYKAIEIRDKQELINLVKELLPEWDHKG